MIKFLTTLKASVRATLVAVTLGAVALVAVPTAAVAQAPQFRFDFGIQGGGDGFSFRFGPGGPRIQRACLNWSEVRYGLSREGWEDIELVGQTSRHFTVEAVWYGDWQLYSMRVNRCTGDVSNIRRVRPVFVRPLPSPGPSFGLQFNFR